MFNIKIFLIIKCGLCNISATRVKVLKVSGTKDPEIRKTANHFRSEKSQTHGSMDTYKCGKGYQTARTRGKWSLRKNV